MYNLKVASILAMLALSSPISASCNNTGQKADEAVMKVMQVDAQLETICTSLTGDYFGKEERTTCIQIGDGKYDFTLRRKGSSTRNIAAKECKDGMKKELACPRGGKTGYENWWYRADYNKGQCTQPVNKRDESEAGSVKDEAGDSVTEPEAPLVVRRSHSREFEA